MRWRRGVGRDAVRPRAALPRRRRSHGFVGRAFLAVALVVLVVVLFGDGLANPVSAQGSEAAASLTARVAGVPERHDGSSAFSFELYFSEEVDLSYRTLRDTAFEATGATVRTASRRLPPSNVGWNITVVPASDADVVLVLAAGRACDVAGAVCTAGGVRLSEALTVTVEGPVEAAVSLTARVVGVPERHDGSSAFSFELYFSEEVALSYRTVRDTAFEVTGAAVRTASRRSPPSNVGWNVTVVPASDADVVLVLAAGRACDVAGAVCTAGGVRLSEALTVTVEGPAAPVVGGVLSFVVVEGETAVGALSATDADSAAADLVWSVPAGAAGGADRSRFSLSSGGVLAFAGGKDFEAPDDADSDGTYEVTVQVSDGSLTGTADVTVALSNRNEAPTADAGGAQSDVAAGATVTLSGTATEPDADDTLSYAWTQTAGETVTLTAPAAATTTFTAPSNLATDATLTFTLRVTDAGGLHDDDTVQITVTAPPAPAAPVVGGVLSFVVVEGETAVGSLSATDADTDVGDLVWSVPAGAAGGADRSRFSLSSGGVLAFAGGKDFEAPDDADSDGTYEVTVQVSDGSLTGTADVTVVLSNRNEAPTADAGGDQSDVAAGATVTLSGTATDPDTGDTLSYAWTQTAGEAVTLTAPAAAATSFTAPSDLTTDATLTFTLRVTDAGGLSHQDQVAVTVRMAADDATPSPFDANDAAAYVAARDALIAEVSAAPPNVVGASRYASNYAFAANWHRSQHSLDPDVPLGEDDPNSLPSPADPQALKEAIDALAEAAGLPGSLINGTDTEDTGGAVSSTQQPAVTLGDYKADLFFEKYVDWGMRSSMDLAIEVPRGAAGVDRVVVQWRRGVERYDDVRRHEVSINEDSPAFRLAIQGLDARFQYAVRVSLEDRRGNVVGITEATGALRSSAYPVGPGGAPRVDAGGLSLLPGATWIDVVWPATAAATGHTVQWKPASDAGWDGAQQAIAAADATGHTLEGLTAGRRYTVRVRANTVGGTAGWFGAATAGLVSAAPSPLLLEGDHRSIVASWGPPRRNRRRVGRAVLAAVAPRRRVLRRNP